MRLIIEPNYELMSQWAANYVVNKINAAHPTAEKPFVLGLPTGSSPIGMYQGIVKAYKEGRVSFKHVLTFNMDEYVGLPEEHPESYHSFMFTNFFNHIDEPRENIHILNGNAADPAAECAAYEKAIVEAGGIDLFMGGIGEDGHIAFNEPFSPLESRTRVVTLTQDTREVNSRFFGGDPEAVPAQAMSVGVATVMASREVMILAFGSKKARALASAIEGPMSHYNTVSALQSHPAGIIVCDEAAIGEVKVNSYRYFKAVEAAENR
jgi:glucosamine-6-phosphate deaminase